MNQIQRNKIYLMIGTGGLISLAFFLTIPLIGLYAIDQFKVSTSQAGLLSSIWPATVFVCSFFVGRVADRWGYFKSMKLGNVICTVAFALMASTSSLNVYIATLVLFGIGKSLNESSMRAAIASMSPPDELARFMRLRYVLINIVCVGGPFLGFVSYKAFSSWAFAFSGLLYGLVFMILSSMLKSEDFNQKKAESQGPPPGRFAVFRDSQLQRFIVSGTLVTMAYGCFETIMPVLAEASHGLRPNFGILSGVNAITVVISQVAILRWAEKVPNRISVLVGFALMCGGFLLFTIESNAFAMSLLATFVFSLGESFLFPAIELVLNDIALIDQRAAYFAAAETKQIGFFLGPALGGFILDRGGDTVFFLVVSAALGVAMIVCSKLLRSEKGSSLSHESLGTSAAS